MIITLSGADTFRTREKLHEIRERFRREIDPSGFSINEIDGMAVPFDELRAAILTPSLLSPKRLVIVRDILRAKKDVQEGVSSMCAENQVPPECVLVFVDGSAPIPARAKRKAKNAKNKNEATHESLTLLLQKQKYAQNFPELEATQAREWVIARSRDQGRVIEPRAAEKLVMTLGSEIWQLANELDKLLAYCPNTITGREVDEVVGTRLHEDIFALVDAIGNRESIEALRRITEHLELGVETGLLAGMLIREIRLLTQARGIIDEAGPRANLTSALGLHPFVARKITAQVTKFSPEQLKTLYDRLMDLERGLKTSRGKPEILFTQFVAKATIC